MFLLYQLNSWQQIFIFTVEASQEALTDMPPRSEEVKTSNVLFYSAFSVITFYWKYWIKIPTIHGLRFKYILLLITEYSTFLQLFARKPPRKKRCWTGIRNNGRKRKGSPIFFFNFTKHFCLTWMPWHILYKRGQAISGHFLPFWYICCKIGQTTLNCKLSAKSWQKCTQTLCVYIRVALCEQNWQVGGDGSWWEVMVVVGDFVNCGCREVLVRLQYNTDDSTSPFTKASTFDPPLSICCPFIFVSRLVLLICRANLLTGVVRNYW